MRSSCNTWKADVANGPSFSEGEEEEEDEYRHRHEYGPFCNTSQKNGEANNLSFSKPEDEDEYEGERGGYTGKRPAAKPIATSRSKSSPPAADPPCFGANFSFGVVSGIMRLKPAQTPKKKGNASFKIKNNRKFEFKWRGRETGESEIQLGSDKDTYEITFGNYGTTFTGTFGCRYVHEATIKGTKVSHGHDQRGSSAARWEQFSELAHERESRSRWGGSG